MIIAEAAWIRDRLKELNPRMILNLGSSTRRFREVEQPFIAKMLEGYPVLHIDGKNEEGVDIVYQLGNGTLAHQQGPVDPDTLCLLTNMLEHTDGRESVLRDVARLQARWLIVSVPYEWPYHPDPIDTMYRPSPLGLAQEVRQYDFGELRRFGLLNDARGAISICLFDRYPNE